MRQVLDYPAVPANLLKPESTREITRMLVHVIDDAYVTWIATSMEAKNDTSRAAVAAAQAWLAEKAGAESIPFG